MLTTNELVLNIKENKGKQTKNNVNLNVSL